MSAIVGQGGNRRTILSGGACFAAATVLQPMARGAPEPLREFNLTAAPGRLPIIGPSYPSTDVWCYGNHIPGPEVCVRQGEPVRITVQNQLPEDTTVHWHGVRLPNHMDGVHGLTQPPIKPGEHFAYEFTLPDAGTFWYHPHADSLRQLGQGMAGAVIVEEPDPVPVDRDLLWVLSDWRLRSDGQIASGFGNGMEAAMAGRVCNTVTVNGVVSNEEPVRAGERVRLRLVNSALARIMALRFEGHHPVIVAIDGQPCDPHEPEGNRLLLGPAMRADLMLDMRGEPGRRYRIIDNFYDSRSYWVTQFAYDDKPPLHGHSLDPQLTLVRSPLPEPDLANAEGHVLALQGGMMSGRMMSGMAGGMGGQGMAHGASWSINGKSMTGDGHTGMQPLFTFRLGRSYVLAIRNETAWWHPIHLHGHSMRLLSRKGVPIPHRQWTDTVLVPPRETVDVAFVADNPGDWMLHCHVTDHQMSGLMTVLRVA